MTTNSAAKRAALSITGLVALLMFVSSKTHALDAAKDRQGLFWGMGFGGGGALTVPEAAMGGYILFDLQLGAGVTRNLTLSLDTDVVVMLFDARKNAVITPGPEITYVFGDTGLFVRGGLGVAMCIVRVGDRRDFTVGFDAGAGFGWEFFANNNLALGLALEADYIVRNGQDFSMFGFMFNLKYY
jgi:hypothetical protein